MNGEFLANRRIELGLSQGKVAETLGYSAQTISLWEKGKGAPSLPIWGKLAALYQLDLEGLLLDKESKANENCESKEFDPASFGPFLRSLRRKEGLTQAELAERIGVPSNAIIRFEQGSSFPELEKFKALAALFRLSYDDLYFCAKPASFSPIPSEEPTFVPLSKRKMPIWVKVLIIAVSAAIVVSAAFGIAVGLSNRNENDGVMSIYESSSSLESTSSFESGDSEQSQTFPSSMENQTSMESIESSVEPIESSESQQDSSESPEEASASEGSYVEGSSSEESFIEESSDEMPESSEPTIPDPVLYHVDFDLGGGTSASYQGPKEVETLDSCLFFDVSKAGYEFKGWLIGDEWIIDENGDYIVSYTLASDIVLTAKYEAINYPIYYVLDGGENNKNNPSFITVNDTVILQNPIKNGFIFVSWYSDEGKENPISSFSGSDLIETGSITIYAKFEYNALDPYNYPKLEFSKLSGNKASVKGISNNKVSGTLTIPGKIILGGEECLVTEIENNAFSSFSEITGIVFPSHIERIGNYAFSGCAGLTGVNLRSETDETIHIGKEAFANCDNLTLVYLSYLVDYIGDDAFVGSNESLIILFQGDYDSEGLGQAWNSEHRPVVPYSLGAAVYGSGNVFYAKAGEGENQGYFAASVRNNPSSVSLVSSISGVPVMGVAHNAFYGASFSSFTLCESMVYIGEYAFAYCSSLSSIFIPESVDTILSNAFLGDTSLTIYCESYSKPYGWSFSWNPSSCPVHWGA